MQLTGMFLALGLSFGITALLAPVGIPLLKRLKFGQSIRAEGPSWHKGKQGTPTMGGLFFIAGITCATMIFASNSYFKGEMRPVIALLNSLAFGFIGFVDDYIKVVKKRNLGLSARQKFLLQLLVGVVLIFSLRQYGYIDTTVYIPFFNIAWDFGLWYYPFALFVIVGVVNSVNLTDGLDGLAASVTVPVAVFFTYLSIFFRLSGTAVFGAAVVGGLMGFLLFNAHPAKVFMGDTGSLFLGGAVSALAFCFNMPALLILVGIIYLAETMSDILQIFYFKKTRGKRLFKMAPLHHHLELCGWKETKIVWVFTAITTIACLLAMLGMSHYRG